VTLIELHYPKGKRGRRLIGVERMLCIYFLQQWYGLADELLEEKVKWYVAAKRGRLKAMPEGPLKEAVQPF